ncbi:MAG: DUF4340 domain-containing protein [Sphingomonadales bacterium]|nr:DUF4340 domain-containing protein [Sphingomonadales bacterium]
MNKNRPYLLVFMVLATVTWYVWKNQNSGTLDPIDTNFAIEDTASVVRIFIADRKGQRLTLDRKKGGPWRMGSGQTPRPDAVFTMLQTLRRWEVKTPVPRPAVQNVFKILATTSVKVEVTMADGSGQVYYVGSGTPDMRGTYAMKEGSKLPYILHLPGWEGYLSTRFFANEEEMRERVLLRLQPSNLERLVVEYPAEPENSYELRILPTGTFELRDLAGTNLPCNQRAAATLFAGFAFLPVEGFENMQPMRDSVPGRVPEKMRLKLWEKGGKLHFISVYPKSQLNQLDVVLLNVAPDIDRDYFYHHGMNEFGVLQKRAIPWFYATKPQLREEGGGP